MVDLDVLAAEGDPIALALVVLLLFGEKRALLWSLEELRTEECAFKGV